ncbi:MAG: DsbA family protein [Gammaproteobacteria bacterium]
MSAQKPELKVSVFSDYICPFCYIGSRRLMRLERTYDLKVNWAGLEIHPETPPEGMPIERLGYPKQQWTQMMAALTEMAAEEGIEMESHDFTTNSHKALLLSEAAKHAGRETFYALHERLFHEFFSQGKNIGDEQVLRTIACEAGVPESIVDVAWHNQDYEQRLKLNLQHAQELGVRGTPTFVFGQELLVGAVPLADLEAAAARASRPVDTGQL